MATNGTAETDLVAFLEQKGIPVSLRTSNEFIDLQQSYTGVHESTKPRLIVRPQTGQDVAALVSQCRALDLEVVVRGQGHDMHGRFSALGAVSIDLRDLKSVVVSADKTTAWVGGGASSQDVLAILETHGLQAAVGNCGAVGFVGWSLVGGFGPYSHSYGLGADQIVGARVVTARGELVDADERMLKGLRGGGGSLGVVVELEVKVYEKQEILAGLIMYNSTDLRRTVTEFLTNYDDLTTELAPLPRELYLMPTIFRMPTMGCMMTCSYIWNGPESEESRLWLQRASNLASPVMDPSMLVVSTTALGFAQFIQQSLPAQVLGRSHAAAVSSLTPSVIDVLARAAERLPSDSAAAVQFHVVRPDNPSCDVDCAPESVLPYRRPHIALEVLGMAEDEAAAEGAARWALETRDALAATDAACGQTYLALTAPEFVDLMAIYEEKLDELLELKREFDPEGFFKHTLPCLV